MARAPENAVETAPRNRITGSVRWLLRWTWRISLFLLTTFVCYQIWLLGHVWWWKTHNPTSTAFMEQRLWEMRKINPRATIQTQWVEYHLISSHLKRAIVAAEDDKFIDHEGFDFDGMKHAYEKNQKKGKVVAGGSTISQQLAKNLFLSPEKSVWRKGQEAIITVMIEQMMDKERILEIYLNVIEWGDGVFGAEAAARHYFNVGAAKLGPVQAARLASMVPNPRYYDKNRNAPWLTKKTGLLLKRMGNSEIP